MLFSILTITLYLLMPLTTEEQVLSNLPFNCWFPFEVTVTSYWIIYTWQFLLSITSIPANLVIDLVIYAFILSGCSQIDVLYSRFQKSVNNFKLADSKTEKSKLEKEIFENSIQHHVEIFK